MIFLANTTIYGKTTFFV